jgi:hypothetical protein
MNVDLRSSTERFTEYVIEVDRTSTERIPT